MEVMALRSKFFQQMTAVTEGIPLDEDFPAVRFMAIPAVHPGCVHLALQKRSVNIDLFEDLSVGVIELIL
jgi:hypothetical protein